MSIKFPKRVSPYNIIWKIPIDHQQGAFYLETDIDFTEPIDAHFPYIS